MNPTHSKYMYVREDQRQNRSTVPLFLDGDVPPYALTRYTNTPQHTLTHLSHYFRLWVALGGIDWGSAVLRPRILLHLILHVRRPGHGTRCQLQRKQVIFIHTTYQVCISPPHRSRNIVVSTLCHVKYMLHMTKKISLPR